MEWINSYTLTSMQQGIIFALTSFITMGWYYLESYIKTGKRVLVSAQNKLIALKTLVAMFVGSTTWANMYELSNTEIITAGALLGFLAFSKGLSEINENT